MQELSDGDLLYMIYFDRTNFTPKWIQKAEKEAKRRRLTLHVINDDYRATSAAKTIEAEIDLEYTEPRSWQKKLFPWIVGFIFSGVLKLIRIEKFDSTIICLLIGVTCFAFYLWRNFKGSEQPKEIIAATKNRSVKL